MSTEKQIEASKIKQIGIAVPIEFHNRFRKAAERANTTSSGLLRKLVVNHLAKEKNND
jgi:hypothetical protein